MRTLSDVKIKARAVHECDYCSLPINKGEIYSRECIDNDGIYTWKSHVDCRALPSKLGWFDAYDDGLCSDDFKQGVMIEYQEILRVTNPELYESNGFKYPSFAEQLQFVINHHLIPKRIEK